MWPLDGIRAAGCDHHEDSLLRRCPIDHGCFYFKVFQFQFYQQQKKHLNRYSVALGDCGSAVEKIPFTWTETLLFFPWITLSNHLLQK